MNSDIFIKLLKDRPFLILGGLHYPVHRLQAFIAGVNWARSLIEEGEGGLVDVLASMNQNISSTLMDSNSGVGWVEESLRQCGNDEGKAFLLLQGIVEEAISAAKDGWGP